MGGNTLLLKQSAVFVAVNYKEKKMNKFIDKPKKTRKVTKVANEERKGIIIEKGNKKFIKCPKCGWIHSFDTKKCRFCGAEL